ncbi:stage III sporulation protein SpoIIIAB [Fictibacillus phosphorivorans]|uniref:stage III sporulation protein SpoIIIAB n=1 Tax=Fictibacillus phosphorivorans TaxID=1221500 RepID=UPI00203AC140|nr:stage III sporulation protein SpoIIIAB [Fictibacillus phosphorivorans]MCM3716763.1 stage III sporulation protein SpoIIIAB [Fictibacillus phosphorivorans]MCM3774688.1 stage III sporulation protein SpoIIIAB [Fictibacillus phosphorivorans]
MSWFGAIAILSATTIFGFEWAKRVRERPKRLRELKVTLQALEAEIMYGSTPLSEAFQHIGKPLKEPLASFFLTISDMLNSGEHTVQEAWENQLELLAEESLFKSGEIEVLRQFGSTLGRHDKEHQQKQIQLTLAHLNREEKEARDIQERYEKMCKSLGVLMGLLIVILLM